MKQLTFILFCFVLSMTSLSAQNKSKTFADFYVSTVGDDSWSGKLAEPNAAKTDGPFATVKRAKQAVRFFKHSLYRDIFIMIRGGEYKL
ncbi:right-handed parallel beta-helix repeat-containing protein, partial [bacterium]|nr:right-handed parallel beta-helix repeat-containing protein [bacterium]